MHSVSLSDTDLWRRVTNCVKLKRLFSHHVRRRGFFALFVIITIFLFYREIQLFTPLDKRPQLNDRKILESEITNIRPGSISSIASTASKAKNFEQVLPSHKALGQLNGIENQEPIAVVLVIAAKRERAVRNHLEQLIKLRPSPAQFPIVISQDGAIEAVTEVISSFISEEEKISFIHHKEQLNPPSDLGIGNRNYFHIANHYKWALDKIFLQLKHDTAIITEDDLDLADDFFSYFAALKPILLADKTIWCISAWNDNGGVNITDRKHGEKLFRTDFFPGLGWMLTAELWNELSGIWPSIFWDDWMRRQDVRKDRVCIRPEVSRTSHNNDLAGKGSSGGLYKKYLASVRLPETTVAFEKLDLSYLIKKNYDSFLIRELSRSIVISLDDFLNQNFPASGPFVIVYKTPKEYRLLGKSVGLMLDIRSGMPRTAYYGIVTFMNGSDRFYAVPEWLNAVSFKFGDLNSSAFYDEKWDKMTRYLEFKETYCVPTKFTGNCDPKDPVLIAWFAKKLLSKRLKQWGEMIVN